MSLLEASVQRAELPSFPGSTYAEKLVAGREAAMAILRNYRPDFEFDVEGAGQTLREVQAWMDRNEDELKSVMEDPSVSALPERVQAAFGAQTTQDFLIAGFTLAAADMGPWVSGSITSEANPSWLEADALARLRVFGGIVQMEKSGYLAKLFRPGEQQAFLEPVSGTVIVVVAVVTVLLAAIIATYAIESKKLDLNHTFMRDQCDKARQDGDKKTVAACLEASVALQKTDDPFGVKGAGKLLVWGAAAVAGVWALATFGPALMARVASGKKRDS